MSGHRQRPWPIPGSPSVAHSAEPQQRFTITFTIDERLLAKIKRFHLHPSAICKAALSREGTRRERASKARERAAKKRQIVNRFSGEVLSKS